MTEQKDVPRLGEMGLENFAPYLMNRIIGRYNAALSTEMAALGLTTPQMRSLAVLSVMDEKDSRATRVFLMDAGREAYERLWPHMSQASEAMFKGIDDIERRAFVGTLQTILRNIRKHDF
jgi:DNA-binding MarR family transcriptional regulator